MKTNKKYKGFDVEAIRNDFPILHTKVYDKSLIYFDNASTSQKPKVVIDRINELYLTGMELDYKKEIWGSNFEFKNPMAKSSCGCGTSFSV